MVAHCTVVAKIKLNSTTWQIMAEDDHFNCKEKNQKERSQWLGWLEWRLLITPPVLEFSTFPVRLGFVTRLLRALLA